jgi:hypothetical protein
MAEPVRTPASAPIRREMPPVIQRQPAMSRADRPTPAYGLQKSMVGAMGGFRRTLDNAVIWFSSRSGAAKTRLVAVTLLVAWLAGVAAPATLISSLASPGDADVQLGNAASVAVLEVVEEPVVEEKVAEAPVAMQMAAAVAPTDTATPVPPAPTFTAVPPTDTPVPTETPLPPTETFTPVPPTPTDTPVPPTPTATYTPFPPTDTPAPVAKAAAVEQVQAAPERAPAPSIGWDGRLDAMGVHVAGVDVPAGQPYWRIIDVKWGNEAESKGKHHIYAEVLDENGGRLTAQPVVIFWPDGQDIVKTENKPAPEFACNFPMYKTVGSYNVRVDGLPSESLIGLGLGTPELPAWTIHTTFFIKFQRTIK